MSRPEQLRPEQLQQVYRAAVRQAREATGPATADRARVASVWQRLQAGQAAAPPAATPFALKVALVAGGALTAALIVTAVVFLAGPAQPPNQPAAAALAQSGGDATASPSAAAETAGQTTIVRRSGSIRLERDGRLEPSFRTVGLPPGARLTLETDAVADLAIGDQARVVANGPGRLAFDSAGRLVLERGRAAFSVRKQAAGTRFRVRAGAGEVVVRGTRFSVQVGGPENVDVWVDEGSVEWRAAPTDRAGVLIESGQGRGPQAPRLAGLALPDAFDKPWSVTGEAADGSSWGHLVILSNPEGASAQLDGVPLGRTPVVVRWPVGAAHRVQVTAPGHTPWTGEARIQPGGFGTVRATLVATDALTPRAAPSSPSTRPERRSDAWQRARKLLATRSCTKLGRQVSQLVHRAQDNDERAQAKLLAAECYVRRGQRRQALGLYRQVYGRYGETSAAEAALFEAAKLSTELGQRSQALTALARYTEIYPSGRFAEPAAFRRCELLIAAKTLQRARSCLEAYRKRYPRGRRSSEALLLLATLARGQQQWAAGARLYRSYLERDPPDERAEAALYHLVVCLQRGRLPGLAQAAASYLRRFPSGPHAAAVSALQ